MKRVGFDPTALLCDFKILHLLCLQGGCSPSSIGVIAPYRLQCKLLTGFMESLQTSGKQDIEVNTVDKYQGRDKEVIIVSFTHTQRGQDSHVSQLNQIYFIYPFIYITCSLPFFPNYVIYFA